MAGGSSVRDRARRLGVVHSHPTWLVARWLRALGEESTLSLLVCNNARPSYSLRANGAALAAADEEDGAADEQGAATPAARLLRRLRALEGVEATPSPLLPSDFVRVASGLQSVLRSGLVARGLCAVQDESTGLAVQLLDPRPGERLLDACAAPGNKTLLAAGRMLGQVRARTLVHLCACGAGDP
jgi:16S rRNA (cytosine967-C5)-methyltransferase